jgi:hypothetical protein
MLKVFHAKAPGVAGSSIFLIMKSKCVLEGREGGIALPNSQSAAKWAFTGIPEFTSNPWYFLLLGEIYIFYCVCNPVINLIFNDLIRKHVMNLFRAKKVDSKVSIITVNINTNTQQTHRLSTTIHVH